MSSASACEGRCGLRRFFAGVLLVGCGSIVLSSQSSSAADPLPATVADAISCIDLRTWPTDNLVNVLPRRSPVQLTYAAQGGVETTFQKHQKRLLDQTWNQLPGATVNSEVGSATFEKQGYRLSLTVFPGPDTRQVTISLQNHGNVDLAGIPVPQGCQLLSAFPLNAMYLCPMEEAAAIRQLESLLARAGWTPYGSAGSQHFFRNRAVKLQVSLSSQQQNKTLIAFTSELMSAELPAPPGASHIQYADSTTQLDFQVQLDDDALLAFYNSTLGSAGWKPAGNALVGSQSNAAVLFRNGDGDTLLLERARKPKANVAHVVLRYRTQLDSAASATLIPHAAQAPSGNDVPAKQPVMLELPERATSIKSTPTLISFSVPAGQSEAAIRHMRRSLLADGWSPDETTIEKSFGTVSLKRHDQRLSIMFVDPGVIPAEFTISIIDGEFELTPPGS